MDSKYRSYSLSANVTKAYRIEEKLREAQQKDCTTYLIFYFHLEDLGNMRAPEGVHSLSNFKKNLLFILI